MAQTPLSHGDNSNEHSLSTGQGAHWRSPLFFVRNKKDETL